MFVDVAVLQQEFFFHIEMKGLWSVMTSTSLAK